MRDGVQLILEGLSKEKIKTMDDAKDFVKRMLKTDKILGCSMDSDGFSVTVKFKGEITTFRVGKDGTLAGGI